MATKGTPTTDKFLGEIWRIVQAKDGSQLQDYLVVEPPFAPLYNQMINELRSVYPSTRDISALETKVKSIIPEFDYGEDAGSRSPFIAFVAKYLEFLRDVNVENLVATHQMLKALLNQAVLALSSPEGLLVLPSVIDFSRKLAKLAIDLDKRPELVANLTRRESVIGEEGAERITLVEDSANVIREAFKKCLSERSGNLSGIDDQGKPEGRRTGIYKTANICLKLFFHCRKLRSAEQIFGNIFQQSPPLALFPASQRVTYLYYLGRYLFANNHFFRAQLALQQAYNQCHPQCIGQRRQILIYLMTSNIILGRFPRSPVWERPEAGGLADRFQPLCKAIKLGDLASFRKLTDIDGDNAAWFLRKRILLQIANRCEVLVWRCLARRTFLLAGVEGDATSRKAPTMALQDLTTLSSYLERKALQPDPAANGIRDSLAGRAQHTNSIFLGPASQDANDSGYVDPDLAGVVDPAPPLLPDLETVESITASLVEQGFLHGFMSHSLHRFAITGAKNAPALQVGFPKVWDIIKARADSIVPGLVKEEKHKSGGRAVGPGMVVNLSNARPVGAAPA